MSTKQDKEAAEFIKRKQKNLEYFKVALPRIYQIVESMNLTRAELVITPGKEDLDMTVNGQSCYRGMAKEYSKSEALAFLKDNPPENPLQTFPPEWPSADARKRFITQKTQLLMQASPITPDNFVGYYRGSNFFPAVVFLGVGLGYHIELITQRSDIITAFVVERDPEKFALSLFTVDWASICSKFQKRGRSINFVIGFENNNDSMRSLLSAHLKSAVPLYPYLSVSYNHLADVELARAMSEVSKDLALIAANWTNYDDQLIRLKNTHFNLGVGMTYLRCRALPEVGKPLVIVGSGPSMDHRIESLKSARENVIIISAGTGLRPLLAAGIKPDLHVELDPSYSVYEMHADQGEGSLCDIPLLAVNEINPHVPELFGKTRYFYKRDNAIPRYLGISDAAFMGCNPTCTNAALAIGYSLGFRNIFLFGTDYGFESREKDHADSSIHGKHASTEFAQRLKERVAQHKHSYFRVPAVSGGEVWTRIDYFAACRSVEAWCAGVQRNDSSLKMFNCADGAVIEGVTWCSIDQFAATIKDMDRDDSLKLEERLESMESSLDCSGFDDSLPDLLEWMRRETKDVAKLISKAKLNGGKDFSLLTNEVKLRVTPGANRKLLGKDADQQALINQMIQGSVLRIVHHGLTHALACVDGKTRGQFIEHWRKLSLDLLEELPNHFQKVMMDSRTCESNPWSRTGIRLPEPELDEFDVMRHEP